MDQVASKTEHLMNAPAHRMPVTSSEAHALSPMQRVLWSSQRRHPSSPHQNMALLSHISGSVDPVRLAAAFAEVVAASDVLRTTIVESPGGHTVRLSEEPATTEIIQFDRARARQWAAQRVTTPLDMASRGYDSVIIEHPDGTCSWYLDLHHVITDATASAAVFAATAAAYSGQMPDIPAYYAWSDALQDASDPRSERARAHWSNRSPAPRIGALYQPVGEPDTSSNRVEPVVSDDVRRAIESRLSSDYAGLSDDLAWTTLLVTSTALYLHRITGTDRLALGLPVHNRSGLDPFLFGPVMEVFPVDVEIDLSDTFRSLHKRVAKAVMGTIRHARPGTAPRAADIETVINVIPRGGIASFGSYAVSTDWIHSGATDSSHLLGVQLTTYAAALPSLVLNVNRGAADDAQSSHAGAHFLKVLTQLVADPDRPIGAEAVVTDEELGDLAGWGDRRAEAVDAPLIPDRLFATGAGLSLSELRGESTLSGPDLNAEVRRIGNWLRSEHQIGPGRRVGIEMARSSDAVVAILATLWTGGSYVPIDPAQPAARRRTLIERAGCAVVLSALPEGGPAPDDSSPTPVSDADEAYLLFTSGSTGEPKGVPITHRGLADYIEFARSHYLDPEESPVVPLFSALTFDLTVTSLFLPLLTGGTLIIVPDEGVRGLRTIAEHPEITWAKATPSHLDILVKLLPADHNLGTLVVGGEAFGSRLASQLRAHLPGVKLFNEYGPTEAVVGCMIHQAAPEEPWADVPIGRPAPGVELRILDRYRHPVPIGSPGELFISHRGVTAGYLGNDDPGPFVDIDGRRFYRSGDLVRFVAPGVLTYLGRADEQIKVGGIRLDPTEVERQLESNPAVMRAAVRLWRPSPPDPDGREIFTAWVEVADGTEPSPSDLRSWLANRLPAHAVPAAYMMLDQLPMTTNGKLDTALLPAPDRSHRSGSPVQVEATTELEQRVVEVWEQILRIEPISVTDDFFELGGDSLAALESMVAVGDALGMMLREELIFGHRTPRSLAEAIETEPGAEVPDGSTTSSALTPGEEAMLFDWLNEPLSSKNNVGRAYHIQGPLDPDRLREAAALVVERHAPLRTTLGEPRRQIGFQFDVIQELPYDAFRSRAQKVFLEPFDLEKGPLLRLLLGPLDDGGSGLLIAMHHGVIDESGFDALFADLAAYYGGTEPDPLPMQYGELSAVLTESATQEVDRTFWLAPEQSDPVDRPRWLPTADRTDGFIQRPARFVASHLDLSGGSRAATVLAALSRVIGRRTGGNRIEIGLAASVRPVRTRPMVGYALNIIPVVVDPSEPDRTAATLSEALAHRQYPLASIVRDRRQAGFDEPGLQVMLAYGELSPVEIDGFTGDHEVLAPTDAATDVTFFVQVRGDEVNLGIEYCGAAVSNAEATAMLIELESELAPEPPRRLEQLVLDRARLDPDAPAVSSGEDSMSYSELDLGSAAVAAELIQRGVGRGTLVGVLASRHPATVAGILGVLRAGAAYVPIDPDYPPDRISHIISDSGMTSLVHSGPPPAVPDGVELIDLASVRPTEVMAETAVGDADDIAYVIYTSGSTGTPKGVAVRHRNIVYSTSVRTDVYGADPQRFLLLSSFAFDSSMVGLWWTLSAGGELVLPDADLHTDVYHLAEVIRGRQVSHLLAIPALYAVLLGEVEPAALGSLSDVIVAGETCPPNLVASHYAALPQTVLHNEYGPTETTVWSHHHRFEPVSQFGGPVPIGTVIPGAVDLVLDQAGQPVNFDGVGELLVGGPGVSAGYLDQPELTAERFVDINGQLLYRTGDVVRVLEDGALEFVGRVDEQVKIRGIRIELGEIESKLLTDPQIRSAVVQTVDTPNGPRLVAWYSPAREGAMDVEALRSRLRTSLPEAMVPSRFIELAEMPLTPNGKVDRRALPDPFVQPAPATAGDRQTGRSPVEDMMGSIWGEVLGVETVSTSDNFFDLGGDSILSIRIVAGLRRHGIRVRPRDLFEHPTIAELAEVAISEAPTASSSQVRLVGSVPLLPMQQWFFDQGFAEPNHWNQSMWFEASEPIDPQVLETALARVVDHHDVLRARFTSGPDGWTQEIPDAAADLVVQEFRNLNEAVIPAVVESVEASLDIEQGELVGAAIFRQRDSADRVFLTIHHLVVDGVSWRPLLEDLTSAYRALAAGLEPDLRERTASVADWATALDGLGADSHWIEMRDRLPEPSDVRRRQGAGRQTTVVVDAGPIDGLVDRMLVAIGRAHRDVFGWQQLTATLEGHGRTETLDIDLSRTVGWFTAMYPISIDLDDPPPAITEVPNHGVGALAAIPRMPRLVINYLGRLDRSVAGTDLLSPTSGILAGYGADNHRTHDLGVLAHVSDNKLNLAWDFVPDDYSAGDIDLVIAAFKQHFAAPRLDLVDLSSSDLDAIADLLD